jgi:hypothetical protein
MMVAISGRDLLGWLRNSGAHEVPQVTSPLRLPSRNRYFDRFELMADEYANEKSCSIFKT